MLVEWILPDKLAGASRPGLLEPLEKDVDLLRRFGFERLVNLTQTPSEPDLQEAGLEVEHFPIPDMGVPTPRDMEESCGRVLEYVDGGGKAVVHCRAGLGRTGTYLACCLVHRGQSAEDAILAVRLVNSRYIQSQAQERFIHHYAEYLAGSDSAAASGASAPQGTEQADTA